MKRLFSSVIAGMLVVACGGQGDEKPQTYSVTYSVTGVNTSSASVTYENSSGGTAQETITLPWSKNITGKPGSFLYVSAQNNKNTGSITASISINSTVFKTTTSSGGFVIATASGTCC